MARSYFSSSPESRACRWIGGAQHHAWHGAGCSEELWGGEVRGRGDGPCGMTRSLRGGEREEKGHQGQRHRSQHPRSVFGESRGQAAWRAGREGPLPVRLGLQT